MAPHVAAALRTSRDPAPLDSLLSLGPRHRLNKHVDDMSQFVLATSPEELQADTRRHALDLADNVGNLKLVVSPKSVILSSVP